MNAFYRAGPVAAHLLLRSGSDPRILVAFPAGNSGVALWFERPDRPLSWKLVQSLRAITARDAGGRTLRGIETEVAVDSKSLLVKQALLSSIRVLRTYQSSGTVPREVAATATIKADTVTWARNRLDGAPGYEISLKVLNGRLTEGPSGVRIGEIRKLPIKLKIRALTGETPLTPLQGPALMTNATAKDARARNVLAFLSYKEKFLAGSWRFDTYFGRDTLMTLRLLMPILQPPAVESGLLSVLERLAPDGEVAHEEGIGEFAVLQHLHESGRASADPIYDYGMIDGSFILPVVTTNYLLDRPMGRARAAALLDRKLPNRARAGEALVRNLKWVADQARPFSADPSARNLVAIKPGRATGQWRDSQQGLGGGRFPYDVNVAFVPAALHSIDRLVRSGLLDPYLSSADRVALASSGGDALIWSAKAPDLFRVRVASSAAREDIRNYAAAIGVSERKALEAIASRPIEFDALSLDGAGKPVPVVHSDPGFSYLFGDPTPAEIDRSLSAIMRPFPAGLLTDVGIVVANPVFADDQTRSALGRNAYHGTVVWAWQQALLLDGINRQLARRDLPRPVLARLRQAYDKLRSVRFTTRSVRTSELWSWTFSNGHYRIAPFGIQRADEDESNAAQLWSTVILAQ